MWSESQRASPCLGRFTFLLSCRSLQLQSVTALPSKAAELLTKSIVLLLHITCAKPKLPEQHKQIMLCDGRSAMLAALLHLLEAT